MILGHGVRGQGNFSTLVGRIQTAVLIQSLSNLTCKLLMRGGTLLIFGCGVKGQGDPINFGSWGQMLWSTLALCEEMPGLALSSLSFV